MITLVKFTKSDFDRLINWVTTEKEMITFSGPIFQFPITHAQLTNYIAAKNRKVYAIKEVETGAIIGHAELNNIDPHHKNARICRVLIADHKNRNKGYGKQVINKLVEIGFKELNLHRIDLSVFDFNAQAIACYRQCGFEIEGHLKDIIRVEKAYWSTYVMTIFNK